MEEVQGRRHFQISNAISTGMKVGGKVDIANDWANP
jgi:hypothetical protein